MARAPAAPPAPPAAGFTLVEMLVALAIFALVSAAGVMLLGQSVRTQEAVQRRLGEGSGVARLTALLTAELASAQPRPRRDGGGNPAPAFAMDGRGISFVHADAEGAGLSRYALAGDVLVREAAAHVDGVAPTGPAALVRGVAAARWRVRDAAGAWSESWSPDRPDRLPRAVELVLQPRGGAPLVLRFLVAPDGIAPVAEAAP
jgi:general secretion pathway protein J